jgi:probable HAF family extracellular repeat protein
MDGQLGFKLSVNFVDGSGADAGFGSSDLVQFSYAPQANPGFDITEQTLTMDASVVGAPSSTAFAQIIDFQTYPNSGFVSTGTALDSENNVNVTSILSNSVFLLFPDLLSTGFSGAPTTEIFSFTTQTAQASLTSATFLFAVGPKGGPALAPLTYSNIDLPGAIFTEVSGINNSGRMVGAFANSDGILHGYLTDGQGDLTTIDFPGATQTFGIGLNSRGDVVGGYIDADGNTHGFLLKDESFSSVDFPNAPVTFALGINDRGQIAGEYEGTDLNTHGFLLDDGQFISLDDRSNQAVLAATGINNRSEIAGVFFDFETFRGFTLTKDSFEAMDVPGQTFTTPEGINDAGSIIGSYDDFNEVSHGFVRAGGVFRTVDFPGGTSSAAFGINASGQIVGIYSDSAGATHSFLAQPAADDGSSVAPATSPQPPARAKRICGSAEWRQHPEDLRNASSCRVGP